MGQFPRATVHADSSLEKARDLMYDAWETSDRLARLALSNEALELSSDCADAPYRHTAIQRGVDRARKDLVGGESVRQRMIDQLTEHHGFSDAPRPHQYDGSIHIPIKNQLPEFFEASAFAQAGRQWYLSGLPPRVIADDAFPQIRVGNFQHDTHPVKESLIILTGRYWAIN